MKNLGHVLTGEEWNAKVIDELLIVASSLKKTKGYSGKKGPLAGKHLSMLFDKPSLRTRVSFTVAMNQLGGHVIESVGNTRKTETPEDQARVLSGYCDGMVVRTHKDAWLARMASVSSIPVINGLSDKHHPCQILADLLTLTEVFGRLNGLRVAYIGDGNNVLHSLMLIAPTMGIEVHYSCPPSRGPDPAIQKKSSAKAFSDPHEAVKGACAVYTDTWTSMGFESHADDNVFAGYQVNEALMASADAGAVFMHCMPLERGKEVSETLPDSPASIIFQQSENRLHVQKSILLHSLGG